MSGQCESPPVTSCPVHVLLEQTDNPAAKAENALAGPLSGYSPKGEAQAPFISGMKSPGGWLTQRAQSLRGRAFYLVLGKPGKCVSPSLMSL